MDVLLRKIGKEMFSYPASIKLIIYEQYISIFSPFNFYIIIAAKLDSKLCFLRLTFCMNYSKHFCRTKTKTIKITLNFHDKAEHGLKTFKVFF